MAAQDFNTDDLFSPPAGGSSFDVGSFLRTAGRYWWLIVLCVGGAMAAGTAIIKLSRPEYVATAEIKVERRAPASAVAITGAPLGLEGATTTEDLKTIEKSFVSPMLMRRVVREIRDKGLDTALEVGGYRAADIPEDALIGYLMYHCRVALIPDTRLIQISYTNADPVMAQRIANIIMEQGIEHDRDQRISAAGANIRYLRDEVKKLEDNLRASEEKLNAYTRALGNVSIDNDINIVASQLRELNTRSTTAKAERLKIESDYAQIQSCLNDPNKLLTIDSIRNLPAIVALNDRIAEAKNKIAKLSQRYRPSNPFMLQAESELKELQAALIREVLQAPKTVEAALAAARRNEESILREQEAQEEKVMQVRDLAVPSRVLQRQIEADRIAYEAALKRLSEEQSQARSQPVLLQIVNPAGPGIPGGSRPLKVLAMATVAGLLLGVGGIAAITQLDSSIKSPEEAERLLGSSVLSVVPQYHWARERPAEASASEVRGEWLRCPAITDQYSGTAEAIRTLRTSLRLVEKDAGGAILVTSPLDDEGKTFCATNFAVVLAHSGQRTLLVDANLRQPAVEAIVFASGGRTGLSDYLQRDVSLASVIHSTSLANLDVVPAGGPCPFPAESLSRPRLQEFLDETRPLYDRIIIDAAAIATVSDTLAFARLVPLAVLVLRFGRTPKGTAKRSVELLRRAGAAPAGLVLNFAPAPAHGQFTDLELVPPAGVEPAGETSHPAKCPSCHRTFATLQAYIDQTTPVASDPASGDKGSGVTLLRRCACGHEFASRSADHRDRSREGELRRKVFGDLLDHLETSGLSTEEARRSLLLTLKIWRNELRDPARLAPSEAGNRRSRMFSDMLDRLVGAGYSPDQAREKLLHAVQLWTASR